MAQYQGRKVSLNTPRRIKQGEPGYGRKKSVVYVQTDNGKIKKVMFGDPNMTIKKDQPGRRANFRARHNCDNPGPKTKARYWSCRAWSIVACGMLAAWITSSAGTGGML
jgi:hypothetical protein